VKNIIRTGLDIAKDVTGGKKVKEALITRIPEGIKQKPREQQQRKRKRQPAAAVSKKKSRPQPKRKDIFS